MHETTSHLLTERHGHVALVRINRPQVRNALNQSLMADLADLLEQLDGDPDVRVIVVAGNGQAFAAGADVREMQEVSATESFLNAQLARWQRIRRVRKPLIAAVSGYALGGGNELAMVCDIVLAAESAQFGQPEINLGLIPGGGATQRLPRMAGKARAMELILTGRIFDAAEARELGIVSQVVPDAEWLSAAMALAAEIATKPPVAVMLAKEAVLKAFDLPLESGLDYERRLFNLTFATEDRVEGVAAFLAKRPATFRGR